MAQKRRHLIRSTPESDARTARRCHPAAQSEPVQSDPVPGLSMLQAVVAAMTKAGLSCQDIASDLRLPLRTVRVHLCQALRILDLSRIEDLSYRLIAAHDDSSPTATTQQSTQPRSTGGTRSTGSTEFIGLVGREEPLNSLVALDAAEALNVHDEVASRDVAAARAELDRERDTVRQLHEAVGSRDSIGQAKGILMERHKINSDVAFTMLQNESNCSHRKLVDVARDLTYSGEAGPSTS